MQRREFIGVVGSIVTAGLAGCSGEETEYEEGNPDSQSSQSGGEEQDSDGENGESASQSQVELLTHELTQGSYTTKVVGELENTSDEQLGYVEVNVRFYDDEGTQLESSLDNVNDLSPGRKWAFEVVYPGTDGEAVADYDIAASAGF